MRVLNTLYGLYALSIFALVIFLLFAPFIILGPTLPIRRWFGRAAVHTAFFLLGTPLRVLRHAQLPAGRCIVVTNHASYLDGILMTAALPSRYTFVVQDGAANWPVIGLIIRRMGVSFVSRSSARAGSRQMRELMRRLHNDEALAIFPEGTFKAAPALLPFRDGAFLMAARTHTPVVPAVISGSRRMYGDGQKLPRWAPLKVQSFAPIQPTGSDRTSAIALKNAARAVVLAHCGEADSMAQSASDSNES